MFCPLAPFFKLGRKCSSSLEKPLRVVDSNANTYELLRDTISVRKEQDGPKSMLWEGGLCFFSEKKKKKEGKGRGERKRKRDGKKGRKKGRKERREGGLRKEGKREEGREKENTKRECIGRKREGV